MVNAGMRDPATLRLERRQVRPHIRLAAVSAAC